MEKIQQKKLEKQYRKVFHLIEQIEKELISIEENAYEKWQKYDSYPIRETIKDGTDDIELYEKLERKLVTLMNWKSEKQENFAKEIQLIENDIQFDKTQMEVFATIKWSYIDVLYYYRDHYHEKESEKYPKLTEDAMVDLAERCRKSLEDRSVEWGWDIIDTCIADYIDEILKEHKEELAEFNKIPSQDLIKFLT